MFCEQIDCSSHALVIALNHCQTHLAIGCLDGDIRIYDIIATTYSRTIFSHVHLVYSVDWSNLSDRIVSSSFDGSIVICSTLNDECLWKIHFNETFPWRVVFHPTENHWISIDFFRRSSIFIKTNENIFIEFNDVTFSTFNHDGSILLGLDRRNYLKIFSFQNHFELIQTKRIEHRRSFSSSFKQILFSSQSKFFALLFNDRIHLYSWRNFLDDQQPFSHLLIDQITKNQQFFKLNFSSDDEFLCASATRQHRLYIWQTISGCLVQILEDPRAKTMSDLLWQRTCSSTIFSVGNGRIYRWIRRNQSSTFVTNKEIVSIPTDPFSDDDDEEEEENLLR